MRGGKCKPKIIEKMEHNLYVFIKNYTAGHAKVVITNGVLNGFDAWRKLMRDQLPLAEDKRNMLMTEFMGLKTPADAACWPPFAQKGGSPQHDAKPSDARSAHPWYVPSHAPLQ